MLALKANQPDTTMSFTHGPIKRTRWADGTTQILNSYFTVQSSDKTRTTIANVSARDSEGKLVLKPQVFSRNRTKIGPCVWEASGSPLVMRVGQPVWSSDMGGYTPVLSDAPDDLQQLTIAKETAQKNFLSDVANASAQVPVIYAERKKTYQMVSTRLISIWEGLAAAKAGAVKLLQELSTSSAKRLFWRGRWVTPIAKYWLEFWFGWYPTIMDLWNLCTHESKPPVFVAHGRSTRNSKGRVTTRYHTGEWFYKVQCHARAQIEVVNPKLKTLQELGLTNPAAVAWELISLSWLIDYFIGFGSYLQQLDATVGVRIIDYSMTIDVSRVCNVSGPPFHTWSDASSQFKATPQVIRPGYVIYRIKTRELKAPPIPVIRFRHDLSFKQLANALALAIAKTRRL